jgi:hypothetical protein
VNFAPYAAAIVVAVAAVAAVAHIHYTLSPTPYLVLMTSLQKQY